MTLTEVFHRVLNAGIDQEDNELHAIGKRMFNADCVVAILSPWIISIVLWAMGISNFALWWINVACTVTFVTCLWLNNQRRFGSTLALYSVFTLAVMCLCAFLMQALLALPLLLTSVIMAVVSFMPGRPKLTFSVASAFVLVGAVSIALSTLVPHSGVEWIQVLSEYQIMNVVLGVVFVYKVFMFIFLYSRGYTEFQRTEAQAQEHVDRYHTLFDNTIEAIFVLDESSGTILDANQSALDLFGYTQEELHDLEISELFVSAPARDLGEYGQLQTMARNREGTGFYVEFSHFPLNKENPNVTVLSLRNIHDRVLADTQRVHNQRRYQRIFDTNALGIQETNMSILARDLALLKAKGVTDLMGYIQENQQVLMTWLESTHITDINTAMLSLTGAPNKEYFMNNIEEFLTEQAFDAFVQETLAIWNGETSFTGEIEIRQASGEIKVLQYTTNFPTDGNFEHLVYTYVDITDIRRQQHTIEEQVALLNEKNTILERYIESNMQLENFAYVASHDLQTPLRAIMGFTQVLRDELEERLDDEQRRYFGHIVNATGNMNRLIEDLLTYSRVNTRDTNWEQLSPKELLQNLLVELQPEVEAHQALVQLHDLPATIQGDRTRLRQLFQNLITNALKFRQEGQVPLVDIHAAQDERFWHFVVRDNGIGVEPEYQQRIFLLFQKLHSPDDYEGTGIGLAVCKTIVEQHGGQIWLKSTPGEGASFHFTLAMEPALLDQPSPRQTLIGATPATASAH